MARAYLTLVGAGLGRTALVARAVMRRIDRGAVAIGNATIGNATPGPERAARHARLWHSLAFTVWPLLPYAQQCAQRMCQEGIG